MKSFAAVVPEEIEQVHAPDITRFLNGFQVGARRRNNLRDEVVPLFRFARSERYLPKDRTTEAEDVAKMKVARKTVAIFTPEELDIVLENTRPGLEACEPTARARPTLSAFGRFRLASGIGITKSPARGRYCRPR